VDLFLHGATSEIAYGVAPEQRGQGLATRAVRLVTIWSVDQLGVECLEICVTALGTNGCASRRVAETVGFVYVGLRHSSIEATGAAYDAPLYRLTAPRRPETATTRSSLPRPS